MARRVRLIDVLTTSWEMASPDAELDGVEFWLGAIVALGVMMDDPGSRLQAIRPDLGEWYVDFARQHRSAR